MTDIFTEIPTPYRGSGRKTGTLITFANISEKQAIDYLNMGFAPSISIESGFSSKYLYPIGLWEDSHDFI